MNTEEMFTSLVNNAIDFLNQSVAELEKSPKFSVIHFYSGVELFLKARLMKEHWTLLLKEPGNANLTKFVRGDFFSVGLEDAVKRLAEIVNSPLNKDEIAIFNKLREHRNQLVHFFHPEYVPDPSNEIFQNLVIEQCIGWMYLYRLLTHRWNDQFALFLEPIESLNKTMSRYKSYLKAKYRERYEKLQPSLEQQKKRGTVFTECIFCEYEAAIEEEILEPLVQTKCLVCEHEEKILKVQCPACEDFIFVYELGEGECENCGTKIGMDYLLDKYGEHNDPRDEPWNNAYCSNCEYIETSTVVPIGDLWLCLNCFELFDGVEQCGYCAERIAGDLGEDSSWSGCFMCDGVDLSD